VGSSVADLERTELDDFILVLAHTRAERLMPRGKHIICTDTSED